MYIYIIVKQNQNKMTTNKNQPADHQDILVVALNELVNAFNNGTSVSFFATRNLNLLLANGEFVGETKKVIFEALKQMKDIYDRNTIAPKFSTVANFKKVIEEDLSISLSEVNMRLKSQK